MKILKISIRYVMVENVDEVICFRVYEYQNEGVRVTT